MAQSPLAVARSVEDSGSVGWVCAAGSTMRNAAMLRGDRDSLGDLEDLEVALGHVGDGVVVGVEGDDVHDDLARGDAEGVLLAGAD